MEGNTNKNNKNKIIFVMLCIAMVSIPAGFVHCTVNNENINYDTDDSQSLDYELENYSDERLRNTRSGEEDDWPGIWTAKEPMPTKRHGVSSAVFNGKIYVFGGWDLKTVEEYDPITDSWNAKSPMPNVHAYSGAILIENRIYVIGGNEEGGPIDVYDPFNDTWTSKEPMPFKRRAFCVAAVNDKIYIIGGSSHPPFDPDENESYYYDDEHVLEYNPFNESWTKKAQIPVKNQHAGISVFQNKIYFIGGALGGAFGNSLQIYDPLNDNWTIKSPMLRTNYWFGTSVLDNKIHVIGGKAGAGETHDVYDPTTDTWTESVTLPTGRNALAVSIVNNILYAIGGRSEGSELLDVNEAFYLSGANEDFDNDGLTNIQEIENGTYPDNSDSDGDSLGDGFEVIFSKTNATLWDTNGNGIGDGLEFVANEGYAGGMQSLPDDWIGMTITWENYTIFIKTNSSVLEGEFEKDEQKLTIKVSGPDGTLGATDIYVPIDLCDPEDIEIQLDGELINYTLTQNETYYHIHIEYIHSVHELTADFNHISEVPSEPTDKVEGFLANIYLLALIIALIIILLLSIVVIRNRGKSEDIGVQELPPEQLLILLEKQHDEGKITDETYDDAKSLLEQYGGD